METVDSYPAKCDFKIPSILPIKTRQPGLASHDENRELEEHDDKHGYTALTFRMLLVLVSLTVNMELSQLTQP